jgi:hypothetical protein
MRVYVAGAWIEQHERARPVMEKLRAAGFVITQDWTRPKPAEGEKGHPDAKLTKEDRQRYAGENLQGVLSADLVMVLTPNTDTSYGVWTEMGMAIAHRQWLQRVQRFVPGHPQSLTVIAAGPAAVKSIFTELADIVCPTDDDAVEWALGLKTDERQLSLPTGDKTDGQGEER